jgi:hypothetical protein
MCKEISGPGILPGWACCKCNIYNGPQRRSCKYCGRDVCKEVDRKAIAAKAEEMLGYKFYDPREFDEPQKGKVN